MNRSVLTVPVALLLGAGLDDVEATVPTRVGVRHVTESTHAHVQIDVSQSAVATHIGHGDTLFADDANCDGVPDAASGCPCSGGRADFEDQYQAALAAGREDRACGEWAEGDGSPTAIVYGTDNDWPECNDARTARGASTASTAASGPPGSSPASPSPSTPRAVSWCTSRRTTWG